MALLERERSIVVVVDLQGKLMDMIFRRDLVIAATKRLLRLADAFAVPVLLTEQYPRGLGPTHPELRATFDALTTRTGYLAKTSFGCCADEQWEPALAALRPGLAPARRQLVVAGIEAHICVMATVLEALAGGAEVHLCWEAISGRGEEYRRHALERMSQAGAVLTNHESAAFEWARDKNHPAFPAVNAILREGQLVG